MSEEFRAKLASPESVLEEIETIKFGEHQTSVQMARRMYEPSRLPQLLREYLVVEGEFNLARAATKMGMSRGSLAKILEGKNISENMLFRLEQYFRAEVVSSDLSSRELTEIIARPWRLSSSLRTQQLVAVVTRNLADLLGKINASNQLGSSNSPINELQKAQLIAILETTLAMLKAPAIKADETASRFTWLKRVLWRGAEKGLEKGISDAMSDTIASGADLIQNLATQPGAADLDKLL